MGDLTTNFSRWEFKCRCGCGLDDVNINHVDRLQAARDMANVSFDLISGCRCKKHNKDEGGTDMSDHLTGEGSDVKCMDSATRFKIINAAVKVGFLRIGIGKTFIHLGTAVRNPQFVIWVY